MRKQFLFAVFSLLCVAVVSMAQPRRYNVINETNEAFFKTDEARRIGEQILLFQRVTGGWPKNMDMVSPLDEAGKEKVLREKSRRNDSTIDNGATNPQLAFLARLYKATGDVRYRDAFRHGIDFLISGQYDNGGWPQFWPENRGYQVHITYNDDAMVNTMNLIREVAESKAPYDGDIVEPSVRKTLEEAFYKGVECILNTQIVVNGKPTVWCQQHDHVTLEPAPARAYELPSFCSQESRNIVRLLMSLPNPDKRVKRAVHGAMAWFDKYKLTGLRLKRTGTKFSDNRNVELIADPTATPTWARYYDLERCEPYVCDRDGIPRRHLEEIGLERRTGYSWYDNRPAEIFPIYEEWANRYDPKHKVKVSLETKGANENGTIVMFRQPKVDRKDFDVVVRPGESIQAAIDKAPEKVANKASENGEKPFKILLLKGTYNQKVIIDRPNIVLVGEDRDSTIILYAEGNYSNKEQTNSNKGQTNPNKGQTNDCLSRCKCGEGFPRGVIHLCATANDCVISGLTVYNNYGTTVEQTTSHQFAIFGAATRTIVINSNVWADGNDALALWAKDGDGMYYHADLFLRCPGVDFLCPRGWCYATRCKFYGDSRAIIWHDGRGDKTKKLVITESYFDAKSPTKLGRWHHDSQFFIVNCKMSDKILDSNISYAYSDKVLDPCPWGQRIYYYGCSRQGGDSGWLRNNLQESAEKPEPFGVTARWTFGEKWHPEAKIKSLWNVLQYTTIKK